MKVNLLVACVLVGLLAVSEGCSPINGEYVSLTVDKKMLRSNVVLHGLTLSSEKDTHFPSDVYSVKFEVKCIYQGAPVDQIIWIDKVGAVPGHCEATNLTVGEQYLVYLSQASQGRYTQDHGPDPATSAYMDEILSLCETLIIHPTGYNPESSTNECPDLPDRRDCLSIHGPSDPPKPEPDSQSVSTSYETAPASPKNQDDSTPGRPVVAPIKEEKEDNKDNGDKDNKDNGDNKDNRDNKDNGDNNNNGDNASAALTWNISMLLVVLLTFLL